MFIPHIKQMPDITKQYIYILAALTITLSVAACGVIGERETPPPFSFDTNQVVIGTYDRLKSADQKMYSDKWMADAIENDTTTLWLNEYGVRHEADTLLSYLQRVDAEGIDPETFNMSLIKERLDSLRSWAQAGGTTALSDTFAIEIEAALTEALIRYSYGQRYGYTLPDKIFSRLLVDADAADKSTVKYRRIYDLRAEKPTDSLAHVAIERLHNGTLAEFLDEIQPDSKLHSVLSQEYLNATRRGDKARARLARINLERSRWRYERPDTGRYVFVNLAAQQLRAVDTHRDSVIEMRICCGNLSHKSPMLRSKISYMEFNPYWVVPQSIIRNEVVPRHLNDSAYFARNNMEAIDNRTNETRNPRYLTADEWLSGRYTLRQDKGRGNSLGRIIFRFPNDFAVYLHDTNQPGAFDNEVRTVSHGCIRVQRPMDLATFLLGADADPVYIDRIRMSIDMQPLTEAGRKLKLKDPEPLKRHSFKPSIPVSIDYYTLYPSYRGKLQAWPDTYGYDKAVEQALEPVARR